MTQAQPIPMHIPDRLPSHLQHHHSHHSPSPYSNGNNIKRSNIEMLGMAPMPRPRVDLPFSQYNDGRAGERSSGVAERGEGWRPAAAVKVVTASDFLGHGSGSEAGDSGFSGMGSDDGQGFGRVNSNNWVVSPASSGWDEIPSHIANHPLFSHHANASVKRQPDPEQYLSTSAPTEVEGYLEGRGSISSECGYGNGQRDSLGGRRRGVQENMEGSTESVLSDPGPSTASPAISPVDAHASFWSSRFGMGGRQEQAEQLQSPARLTMGPRNPSVESITRQSSIDGSGPFSPASAFLSAFSSPGSRSVRIGAGGGGGSVGDGGGGDGTGGSLGRESDSAWGGKLGESLVGRKGRIPSFGQTLAPPIPDFRLNGSAAADDAGSSSRRPPSMSPQRSFSLSHRATSMAERELASSTHSAPDGAGAKVLNYTLGKIIGRGGFSTVRLAIHDETKEKFACRIIKRDDLSDTSGSLENFEMELELWQSLPRHPRILPLLDIYRDEEGYATYLISPYMSGGSLLDVVRRDGGSEATARKWFPGIVAAVQALHEGYEGFEGGMLHGDLKLDNFLVAPDGSLCVCDFGLAQKLGKTEMEEDRGRGRPGGARIILESRQTSRDRGGKSKSRSRSRYRAMQMGGGTLPASFQPEHSRASPHLSNSTFMDSNGRYQNPSPARRWHDKMPGTKSFPSASLPYAPPEILSGPPCAPCLAQDMWALGIILHALLTSKLPFVDSFDPRLQMKIIRGDWAEPQHISGEWIECLHGLLDGNMHNRWKISQLATSDAVQGWRQVRSRSRSSSRVRSGSSRDRFSISPVDEKRNSRSRSGARAPSNEGRGRRNLQPPTPEEQLPSRPRSISRSGSRGAPPSSGLGRGLTSVRESTDDLQENLKKLSMAAAARSQVHSQAQSRSRSRGTEGSGVFDIEMSRSPRD